MDFERILSEYRSKTCIISVEKYPDGSYGNIRIAAGNKAHYDEMANALHHPFIPDSPYEQYFPQNRGFEDFCYRCAVQGQLLHAYVALPQMNLWLNLFMLPLESDQYNKGYCVYSYEITPEGDPEKRAFLSAETSAAILKTCIKLRGAKDLRQTFSEVIEDIRQICDSDHCCIVLVDQEEGTCSKFCEAIKPNSGFLPMDKYLDEKFYSITQTWGSTIGDNTGIVIKDQREMEWLEKANPVWYKFLLDAGIRSIVLYPLKNNEVTFGYIWASNYNVDNTVKILETLELTTFFVAAEISNYQLLKRLETLSSVDSLTGVQNRNRMNMMVDDIVSGKVTLQSPYAVIYADLNGLKRVNDESGHGAGDRLLIKAATILRETFSGSSVYRAGGDEFMVIAPETDEETLKSKRAGIKERAAAEKDLSISVGTYVVRDNEDILTAMRNADQDMYADKKEFYATHYDRRSR